MRVEATRSIAIVCSSGERAFDVVELEAGETVEFGPDEGLCRAYLAVAGGVDVPMVLDSRSTLANAGFGGFDGRVLGVGDELPVGAVNRPSRAVPSHARAMVELATRARVLRVVVDGAGAGVPAGLLRVSPKSDRVGIRLDRSGDGEPIGTGPSLGVLHGTIQAPSSDELVILGPDGPTTGGYAMVGTVIAVDLPAVGQLVPGQWVRLDVVGREEARELFVQRRAALDAAIAPVE